MTKINTDILLAASIAAYRLNSNQYVKEEIQQVYSPELRTLVSNPDFKPKNSTIVKSLLADPVKITDEDLQKVEELKTFVQGLLLFRVLKNDKISDFEDKMLTIARDEEVDENQLAIAAYMPQYYTIQQEKQQLQDRLQDCQRDYIGRVTDKIQTTIEVVQKFYSQKYDCNFITAITDDNKRVLFAYSGQTELNVLQKYSIKATVKRLDSDWVTVLGRVKPTKI